MYTVKKVATIMGLSSYAIQPNGWICLPQVVCESLDAALTRKRKQVPRETP